MREERVTKNILGWLENKGWTIICYDFPQSGTGVLLHPNNEKRTEKNKGCIIPDIIAVKNEVAVFFENKDRFYQLDFDKLFEIKSLNNYSDSLNLLLKGTEVTSILYGIGLPSTESEIQKSTYHLRKIDFLISTNRKKEINVHYDNEGIFANA